MSVNTGLNTSENLSVHVPVLLEIAKKSKEKKIPSIIAFGYLNHQTKSKLFFM